MVHRTRNYSKISKCSTVVARKLRSDILLNINVGSNFYKIMSWSGRAGNPLSKHGIKL